MSQKPSPQQTVIEMVTLDQLVPEDHLLRKIDVAVDFSSIHDRVTGLYCPDIGRPALDPTVMFKALFLGYLFGLRSERQLVGEIEVNVAYRWFSERRFADAKQLSRHRHARFRGLVRVSCQCLPAVAAQNIKQIALIMAANATPMAI